MTTTAQSRLNYLGDYMSNRTISGLTGIPESTIGFVRRGERNLPSEYAQDLRNQFQRVAYNNLRSEGFSYHQARRYSSYGAVQVKVKEVKMKTLVKDFTLGAVGAEQAKLKKQGIIKSIEELYDDMLNKVKTGLSKSSKDFEEIERY